MPDCQAPTGATVAQAPEPRPNASNTYRSHRVKHEPVSHNDVVPAREKIRQKSARPRRGPVLSHRP